MSGRQQLLQGTDLFPSGWKATLLMGPKWPLTRPNSSSKPKWKNLKAGRTRESRGGPQGTSRARLSGCPGLARDAAQGSSHSP